MIIVFISSWILAGGLASFLSGYWWVDDEAYYEDTSLLLAALSVLTGWVALLVVLSRYLLRLGAKRKRMHRHAKK